ncbi:MAG: hypothetical protein PSV16_05025 [Flavobacterium sp.]|nr:hypothetical protein [Flavobacterium sp.]
MRLDSELGMELSMYRTMKSKVLVELKSSKHKPFTAKVKDFVFGEEETSVEFIRLDDTVFPDEKEGNKSDSYITEMKNIKSVERIRELS